MDKNLILLKLNTLFKEYHAYKDFLGDFLEGIDERKKDVAKGINDPDFEERVEEFILDAFVLKHHYEGDISILIDKMLTYQNAARLIGIEKEIKEDIVLLLSKHKEREFRPRFIIEGEKPVETIDGFVEEQRKQLREQGNISQLLKKVSK